MKNRFVMVLALIFFFAASGAGMLMAADTPASDAPAPIKIPQVKIPLLSTDNAEKEVEKTFGNPMLGSSPQPDMIEWRYKDTPYKQYILAVDLKNLENASPPDFHFWSLTLRSYNTIDENLPEDAFFLKIKDVLDEKLLSMTPQIVGFDTPVSNKYYSKIPMIIVVNEDNNYLQVEMEVLIPNQMPFVTRQERLINPDTNVFMVKKSEIDFNYVRQNWKELYLFGYKQFGSVSQEYYNLYSQGMPLWEIPQKPFVDDAKNDPPPQDIQSPPENAPPSNDKENPAVDNPVSN
ncbi:MAG: hypothetical protein M1269_04485 [Chloroflexi bacterium]|nr:hypothetical protein [Chloroflexota bacterium]